METELHIFFGCLTTKNFRSHTHKAVVLFRPQHTGSQAKYKIALRSREAAGS